MRPDLLPLIRFAARRGFEDIKVQTNGLVFASPDNLQRAVDAGMNRVAISVHGYHPANPDYETVTGAQGSEAMMLRAVENLVAAGVELGIDMIVMRSSLGSLLPAIRDLHGRGVRAFNLWFVSLTDANSGNVDSMPTMREAAPFVTACMDYGRAEGVTVESLHIPRCVLPGYEDHVRHPAIGRHVRVVTPESVFDLAASRLSGGVLPETCASCRYFAVCPGAREDYVARYGTDELVPVPAGD